MLTFVVDLFKREM